MKKYTENSIEADNKPALPIEPLIDPTGRHITYLRLSVTDRCDFRCRYCMAEKMTFLPKSEILSLEELYQTALTFMACGIDRIRLTGGEPLVRRDIQKLIELLGRHVESGELKELTLTTNGSQLVHQAQALYDNHVRRVNVSLDTLDADKFNHITRRGKLDQVLAGIETAKQAGLQVKINMVVMGQENRDDIGPVLDYCVENGFDLTLIETMPMAEAGMDLQANHMPLSAVIKDLTGRYTLLNSDHKTAGPARYHQIKDSQTRLGLITPLSHNFCAGCNRIRLTCTGKLYPCLGHDTHLDFREEIRSGATQDQLIQSLRSIIARKPESHDFSITNDAVTASTKRSMNVTGG